MLVRIRGENDDKRREMEKQSSMLLRCRCGAGPSVRVSIRAWEEVADILSGLVRLLGECHGAVHAEKLGAGGEQSLKTSVLPERSFCF